MAHGELAWLFQEPHAGLDHCLRMLQACFRKRMSESGGVRGGGVSGGASRLEGLHGIDKERGGQDAGAIDCMWHKILWIKKEVYFVLQS